MVSYNIFRLSRRRLVILLSTTALFGFVIWLLNDVFAFKNVWQGFYTEDDIGTYFCEKTFMDKVVRQPVNTFSNFIYWVSALAILRRGWKDQSQGGKYNLVSANPFYSILYGGILLYIFCASTFFHSSLIHFASRLDFSAVYSLALFPLMYYAHRVWLFTIGVPSNTRHTKSTTTVIIAFSLLYVLFTFFTPNGWDDYVVLGIIITMSLMGIYIEQRDKGRTNWRYLAISMASIAFAIMWFAFDVYKVLCNPESYIQPHTLWHLFSGIAAFYFYMYIRSEKNILPATK